MNEWKQIRATRVQRVPRGRDTVVPCGGEGGGKRVARRPKVLIELDNVHGGFRT